MLGGPGCRIVYIVFNSRISPFHLRYFAGLGSVFGQTAAQLRKCTQGASPKKDGGEPAAGSSSEAEAAPR